MLRAYGRAARDVVAAVGRLTPVAGSIGCSASAAVGCGPALSVMCSMQWLDTPAVSAVLPSAALPSAEHARQLRTRARAHGDRRPAAEPRGSAPARRSAQQQKAAAGDSPNPRKHSCLFWTGAQGSCRFGDDCVYSEYHVPGVPSPGAFCPFWNGRAGSCPHGLQCFRLESHVPGKPSPSLLPRLQHPPAEAAPSAAAGAALTAEGAAPSAADEAAGALEQGDDDGELDMEPWFPPEIQAAMKSTAEGYSAMFTASPRATPSHPEAAGSDAWDPVPPSAALVEPGAEAMRMPMESLEDFDLMLEEWEELVKEGRYAEGLTFVENVLADVPGLPTFEEVASQKSGEERRKERNRELEATRQAEYARRRVRRVDENGVAHAIGRRKTSTAQVWLREGTGNIVINQKHFDEYIPSLPRRADVLAPFVVTRTLADFDVTASVRGGGEMGQAQAVRHALARALERWKPELRPPLKRAGFLTRDPRMVERKKAGRRKARAGFQWVKR